MKVPEALKQGDKIAIVAPARKISSKELENAIKIIQDNGYEVVLGDTINKASDQFAGNDDERANDLQQILDNEEIKAVLFARGGYGSVRIIDKIDFSNFVKKPKWLVGYSDITVFHCHLNENFQVPTIHGSMPINFHENTNSSLTSLFDALKSKPIDYKFPSDNIFNRKGKAEGQIIGGNLSVMYSLMGSDSFPDLKGKILFLEDLDEYLYHIDRMMMCFKRAGVFSELSGLLIGGMTDMNDNTIAFGSSAKEIIRNTVEEYNYPIAFDLPIGHIKDNRSLVMGWNYKVDVNESVTISSI